MSVNKASTREEILSDLREHLKDHVSLHSPYSSKKSESRSTSDRCDQIERYMEMGCDNYKLLDLFFAYGNASYFKEEIKCYFTRLGKVDSKLALGKEYSVTTGTGGINFNYMIFDNITVYTSIELFEYIFSMVDFDRETLCYFLRRSIEVQSMEARAKAVANYDDGVKSKNTALLVEFLSAS
jgi:hypothetical protein